MHSIISPLQDDGREKLAGIPGKMEDWLPPLEASDPFRKEGGGDKVGGDSW